MKKRFGLGFTLVEMLVVIAVILGLGAMLYPAISKVREAGRATACLSNLRQLHLAALNYANSNNGSMPPAVSSKVRNIDGSWTEIAGWVTWPSFIVASGVNGAYAQVNPNGGLCITRGAIYSYVKNKDIYLCPSFKALYPTYTRSYCMNTNASSASIMSAKPAALVLFGESTTCMAATSDGGFATNSIGRFHGGTRGHNVLNKGNVVYMDGHAEKW